MQTIANNQWSAGNTNGWNNGHTQGYNEGYSVGFSAGQSAAAPSLTDITNNFSSPTLVTNPNRHRVTANTDLTGYKYIIISFGYRNAGMSLDGNISITNCTKNSYIAKGALGTAILTNVKNGATIDFHHSAGTGTGHMIAYGIK